MSSDPFSTDRTILIILIFAVVILPGLKKLNKSDIKKVYVNLLFSIFNVELCLIQIMVFEKFFSKMIFNFLTLISGVVLLIFLNNFLSREKSGFFTTGYFWLITLTFLIFFIISELMGFLKYSD